MNDKQFQELDKKFAATDKTHIRRTKNIRLIPDYNNRRGGKLAYSEWAHVIGIFQTVIYQTLQNKTQNAILDIGCGTGLLGIASEPFIADGGAYTGIDVMQEDVAFCKSHFPKDTHNFVHFNVANATYANDQPQQQTKWPVADNSQDLVTALSVWTHLNEEDALFYLKEVSRGLKKGAKAIITFFRLDDAYYESLKHRTDGIGRFHSTNQNFWIYDKPAYNSNNWFTVAGVKTPEDAIGVTDEGIKILTENSGLSLAQYYPGNWKEIPGVYFQDILIFNKE